MLFSRSHYRVAIIEDHALFRTGLQAVLASTPFEVIGEAGDATRGLEMVTTARPDTLILDITLPDGGGVALLKSLRDVLPDCRTLVLTLHNVPLFVSHAFDAGALGYALKDQPADEIVRALGEVADGRMYLDPRLPPWLLDRSTRKEFLGYTGSPHVDELSAREREVFDLIVKGSTNELVARSLAISVKTVETHRARINRKLRVRSPSELIRFAALQGLIGQ